LSGAPLLTFCQWLQDTNFSTAIRESTWLFPIIETTHVLALSLSVGTIALVDLRLVGVALRNRPVSEVSRQILPWALAGFTIMFVTGIFLFLSLPMKCYASNFFRVKMVLLVLAGANALFYQVKFFPHMSEWDDLPVPPRAVRVIGALSLLLWIFVIAAGRNMAYRF
jgi:hypothetical protein